ncbi:MAG: Mrp family chromosome partitioning ATPase [Mariniblastus sp.]|jgi:Mrp family chromosome partitioning ATPase
MIDNNVQSAPRELLRARRKGVAPSASLRRHFFALARQVRQWADARPAPESGRGLAIGVTSLTRGAGKSTVSFNLAAAMTSMVRDQVLLIESDFGKHFVSRRLGHAKAPGLSELLLDVAGLEEAVIATPTTNLFIMGAGRKSDQEALELPFDSLSHILGEKLNHFGAVVFDLPLANHLTACHGIVPHLDGVILTVESNQIDQRGINRFRKQLDSQGVEIIGVVLNKA